MTSFPTVKVAACHVAPAFLDASASAKKYLRLVDEAAEKGAHLVVFAESSIPGFPLFASTGAPIDNEGCWARFVEESIYADGPEIAAFRNKAREKNVVISLGFSERSHRSVACIWNSNILIGEKGQILAHHRVSQHTISHTKPRAKFSDLCVSRSFNQLSGKNWSGRQETGTDSWWVNRIGQDE